MLLNETIKEKWYKLIGQEVFVYNNYTDDKTLPIIIKIPSHGDLIELKKLSLF